MGRRISKEFLHPSILEGVNEKIGNLDSLETDAKGNMVQAINELADKIDTEIAEGKELIANAVGEPLTTEESFDEMSSDINGLLSTFKANMMNNGITVESSDRFKSLIDKIATLADNEGKGLKYATGTGSRVPTNSSITINTNLDFVPTVLFCHFPILRYQSDSSGNDQHANVCICSNFPTLDNKWAATDWDKLIISNITKNSFKLTATPAYGGDYGYKVWTEGDTTWYAIGVGEEDTTLRDSLADILENKGVDVTEEDDMASLITKVDSISGGLDIISATELPATGKENQICVITDVKPMSYKMTTNINDKTTNNNEITIYLSDSNSHNMISGTLVPITTGSLTVMYYFNKICQGDKRLKSYIYQNNEWCQITQEQIVLLENGTYVNSIYHGNLSTGSKLHYYKGEAVTIDHINTSWYSIIGTFINPIDVTSYTKVKCLAYVNPTDSTVSGTAKLYISLHHDNWGYNEFKDATIYPGQTSGLDALYTQDVTPLPLQEFTFDITEYTGMYYLGIGGYVRCYGHLFITDMWLE